MMGGAWRKGDRRSSLTYSSAKHKIVNEKLDRHGNKRKSVFSPRRYDGGDDFASRYTKHRSQQSRHPHQLKRRSVSRSCSMSRNPSEHHDSRHCKGRESQSRHPHQLKRRRSVSRSRSMSRHPSEHHDSRRCKCRESQSRHPHQLKRRRSVSRSRYMSRTPSSELHDSRRCKCRESGCRYIHHIKEEPRERRSRASQNYKKRETTYSKRRGSSSDSQHHKILLPVDKKRKYEETNFDVGFFEDKTKNKTSSLMEYSNHFFEKSNNYMTQGSLKKALKCINLALKVCKKENKFSSQMYARRGTIYSLLEKPKCSFQGFLDWEHAFIIDKENMEARINMSKIFFKAANKLFRRKAYNKSLTLCNHALGLHIGNGEASVLFKLLKRKILEKELKEQSRSETTVVAIKSNPENLSVAKCELHEAVLDEVKRLNSLIAEALNSNNYTEALKYCDLALRLFKSDIPDDNVYCDLLVLKKQLISHQENQDFGEKTDMNYS